MQPQSQVIIVIIVNIVNIFVIYNTKFSSKLAGVCWIVFKLDPKNPILYVLPIENILGKLPVVPVGDTGTIPFLSRFPCAGAYGDRSKGAGDGCPLWYVNSWAMGDGPMTCNGGRCMFSDILIHYCDQFD